MAQMEQELNKEHKPANRNLMFEGFRSFVHFGAIVCMISCLVILFVLLVSMERRVALLESKLSELSEKSKNGVKEPLSAAHARRERNVNPTTTLSDLTKRLIALESRSVRRAFVQTYLIYRISDSIEDIMHCHDNIR